MIKMSNASKLLSMRPTTGMTSGISRPATSFTTISQITDHLYLCGALALSEAKIRKLGVTCIINCATELPSLKLSGVQTVKAGVDDVPSAPLYTYFDKVADCIRDTELGGGKTLVHCVAGVSRSPTLCLAYLMKHRGMSLRQAYEHVFGRRPVVRPNPGFWRQLVDYERRLHSVVATQGRGQQQQQQQRRTSALVPSTASMSLVKLRQPPLLTRSFTSWATTYSQDFRATAIGIAAKK